MLLSKGHGIINTSFPKLITRKSNQFLLTTRIQHTHFSNSVSELSNLRKAIQHGNIHQAQTAYDAIVANNEQTKRNRLFNRDILRKLLMTVRHGKRNDDAEFMIKVLKDMKNEYQLPLTHFEYHALMYVYGVQGQTDKAYEILEKMQQIDQLKPNLHSYNTLLGCYKRSNELEKAESLFREMKKTGVKVDSVTYNTLFHFYLKNEKFDRLFDLYKELKKEKEVQPDIYTYSTLLDAVVKSQNVEHQSIGFEIYHTLLEFNKVDTHTINSMIRFIAQVDLYQAFELYHQLEQKYSHTQPDAVTFNILIDLYLKNDQPQKAYKLFRDMKDLDIQPDLITYGTLIDAASKEGDLKSSLQFFKDLCQTQLEPNERILNSLVNASKKASSTELDTLLTVIQRYEGRLRLDAKAYNALMHGLALQGRSQQTQRIYDDVFRDMDYHMPDISTFTHLLLAYINDNKPDDALAIYYTLREHHKKCKRGDRVKIPIELDTPFYSTLISALSRTKTTASPDPTQSSPALSAALTLFNDMRQLRIQPTKQIYTSMLHASGQYRDDYVLSHVHQLIKIDLYLDPDVGIYNALMDAYNRIGDGDTVLEIWETLSMATPNHHLSADQTTVSIVLDSCGHNGKIYQAQAIWKTLLRYRFPLNTNNYTSYIECLCRQRGRTGWDTAYRIIKQDMSLPSCPEKGKPLIEEKTVNTLISFARKKNFDSSEIDQLEKWKASLFP